MSTSLHYPPVVQRAGDGGPDEGDGRRGQQAQGLPGDARPAQERARHRQRGKNMHT